MTGSVRKPALGERHGHLLVIAEAADRYSKGGNLKRFVAVQCDCGTVLEVRLGELRSGHTTSCGDKIHQKLIHGMTGTPTYKTWCSMHGRCSRNSPSRRYYYDRGLGVCSEWTGPGGFERFYADMGPKPPGYSIDRIDNDKGYSPDNCRWVTPTISAGNRRITIFVEHCGERLVLAEAARRIGAARAAISKRVHRYRITHQEAFNQIADRIQGVSP